MQGNHIHLVVGADSARALSEGMRAWTIRVARAINRVLGRKGKVFPERFHAVRLKTARQVRAALCYVLQNARRHGMEVPAGAPDVFSSAWWFTGWTHERWRAAWKPPEAPTVVAAEGWLLKAGWRRWGLIGLDEVPPAARAPRRQGRGSVEGGALPAGYRAATPRRRRLSASASTRSNVEPAAVPSVARQPQPPSTSVGQQ